MTTIQVQCYMAAMGYYTLKDSLGCIAIDDIAGPATKAAVAEFQKDFGLTANGIVDANTEAAILKAIGEGKCKEEPKKETSDSSSAPSYEISAAKRKWRYFTYDEVKCRCGGRLCKQDTEMSEQLMGIADNIRGHFGKDMIITSGIRCYAYNLEVYKQLGKSPVTNSAHISGKAIDFKIPGVGSATILAYARTIPGIAYCYAVDGNVVHINV